MANNGTTDAAAGITQARQDLYDLNTVDVAEKQRMLREAARMGFGLSTPGTSGPLIDRSIHTHNYPTAPAPTQPPVSSPTQPIAPAGLSGLAKAGIAAALLAGGGGLGLGVASLLAPKPPAAIQPGGQVSIGIGEDGKLFNPLDSSK